MFLLPFLLRWCNNYQGYHDKKTDRKKTNAFYYNYYGKIFINLKFLSFVLLIVLKYIVMASYGYKHNIMLRIGQIK